MGAATAREAESIVYRRKSFRKKNSSPAILEPRGSAVGGTTNDSIAPKGTILVSVYNVYGTVAHSWPQIAIAISMQPEDPCARRERISAIAQVSVLSKDLTPRRVARSNWDRGPVREYRALGSPVPAL